MKNHAGSAMRANFHLLWVGHLISQFGSQVTAITLIYWLKEQLALASIMGLSSMLLSLFIALSSPFGGVLADKYSRKRIIVCCDIVSGVTSLLLPFLLYVFPDNLYLLVGGILLMQIVFGVSLGLFDPAYSALLSNVVSKQQLPLANGIKNATIQGSMLVGQASGFFLFGIFGISTILIANGISFLLSALCESWVKEPPLSSAAKNEAEQPAKSSFFADMKQGFVYIQQHTALRSLLILIGGVNLFIGPFVVLLPFFVEDTLQVPTYWYGYLIGAFGVGGLFGYLSLPALKNKITDWNFAGRVIFMGFSGTLFMVSVISNVYYTMIFFALAGGLFGLINTMIETAILSGTDNAIRGRVMSSYRIITRLALPSGMLIAGFLVDFTAISISQLFIVSSALVFIISIKQFHQDKLKVVLSSY